MVFVNCYNFNPITVRKSKKVIFKISYKTTYLEPEPKDIFSALQPLLVTSLVESNPDPYAVYSVHP
jgi:hypothetical protein